MNIPNHAFLGAGLVALLAASAPATEIVSDDFAYSDGALPPNNGGTGDWAGAWAGTGNVAGGQNQTIYSKWANREISTTFTGSPTAPLYFSAQFTKTGTDPAYALWLELSKNAATNDADVRIGLADDKFSVQMEGETTNTTINADFGTITPGQQYLIVGKLEFDTDGVNETLTIWVDPTDVETAALSSTPLTGEDIGWVTPTHVLTGNFVLAGGVGLIDDIKVGTTWADVVPVDSDNDGIDDEYELAHTDPPSTTALVPGLDDDSDGLTNLQEFLGLDANDVNHGYGQTLASVWDSDGDGLNDGDEVSGDENPYQVGAVEGDAPGAKPGAPTDPNVDDCDGDTILDGEEVAAGSDGFVTNPWLADTDGDLMGDLYEVTNNLEGGLNPTDASDETTDLDDDGLLNWEEHDSTPQTRADKADTDDDGYDDPYENDSTVWDSDTATGTDPTNPDSDGDGLLDGEENPDLLAHDPPNQYKTDPNIFDSDEDGFGDLLEIEAGSDPSVKSSTPPQPVGEIATENFDYSDGALAGANGGTGAWIGAWAGAGSVTNGRNLTATSAFGNRRLSTAFAGSPTEPLYFSAKFTKTGTDSTYAVWMEISNNSTVNDADVRIGLADDGFYVGMEDDLANTETTSKFGTVVDGQEYLIVGKLEFNTSGEEDTLTMWVDPTGEETGGLSDSVTGEDIGWVVPSYVLTGNYVLSGGVGLIDDIKIGTRWSDVASDLSGPAPPALEITGVDSSGRLLIQASNLDPAKAYDLKRGTDLIGFPDFVDSQISGVTEFEFLDDDYPVTGGRAFYKLKESE